jgi:hypothetical protein
MPFVTSLSRKIKFATMEYVSSRSEPNLIRSLLKIVKLYKARGFEQDSTVKDDDADRTTHSTIKDDDADRTTGVDTDGTTDGADRNTRVATEGTTGVPNG